MENLLAFIEFTQFQQYLIDNFDVETKQPTTEFPISLPTSIILEKKQSEKISDDVKMKAHLFCKKYVSAGGEFEINVSAEARNEAVNLLNDLDLLLNNKNVTEKDLFAVIDVCKWEIWRLLLGSYCRFKAQPEYNEFDSISIDVDGPKYTTLSMRVVSESPTVQTP